MKTVNDILKAVNLKEDCRKNLLYRIRYKYVIEPVIRGYRIKFSEEDFKKIVEYEKKRDKRIIPDYSRKKRESMYQLNKENRCYSRLTYYGGLNE